MKYPNFKLQIKKKNKKKIYLIKIVTVQASSHKPPTYKIIEQINSQLK